MEVREGKSAVDSIFNKNRQIASFFEAVSNPERDP
jgi:hypothetical protein